MTLFNDESGLEIIRRCDQKIGQLPGLEGFHAFEDVVHRTAARWGDGTPAPKPLLRAADRADVDGDPGEPLGLAA